MKNTSVCLIAPYPPPYGGIAHWTSIITEHANSRSDISIHVINTAPRWRKIHNNNLLIRALGGGVQLARDILIVTHTLIRKKFNSIHLTTSGSLSVIRDLAIAYIAKTFRIPLTYHIRFGRIPDISQRNSFEWRVLKRVAESAETVISIDRSTLFALKEHAPKAKSIMVPNCIDLKTIPQPSKVSKHTKTLLFVGWVLPSKGIAELISAWQQILPPDWSLDIVGPVDPEYRQELLSQIPDDSVRILGELPHNLVMEKIANCDLFVLPSHTEGFPNVVLEAMAMAKPIIATRVGAIPEMLDGHSGLLIPSKDVPALVSSIKNLIEDPVLRKEIGERAQKKAVSSYSLDIVFEKYVSLWNSKK